MKQTYSSIAEALRTNKGGTSNLSLLGELVVGSNITKDGIRKLLRLYCKTDYDTADKEKIVEDYYKKGKQVAPKRNATKTGLL